MPGNAEEEIERHLHAIVERGDLAGAVDLGDLAAGNEFDVPFGEGRLQRP